MKITNIQFFNQSFETAISETETATEQAYNANVTIDDKFIIQLSGNKETCDATIPAPALARWKNEQDQQWAYENLNDREVMEQLEELGLENNYDWLEAHADETY